MIIRLWLTWPSHALWHFCHECFISHYNIFFFFFAVISSAKYHWHSHDKFRMKQDHANVMSSTVMIRWETQTVGATITCLVTFCATNSWSVIWSWHFLSVIINVTKHVIDPPTGWVSSLNWVMSWFKLSFSHECWWLKQWHLAALFTYLLIRR